MAQHSQSGSSYSQENLKQIACNHLNLLLLPDDASTINEFWFSEARTLIEAKFGSHSLRDEERASMSLSSSSSAIHRSIRSSVASHLPDMLQRLISLCGIELTLRAREFIHELRLTAGVISGASGASMLPSMAAFSSPTTILNLPALGSTAVYDTTMTSSPFRQAPLILRPRIFGRPGSATTNTPSLNRYDVIALHPVLKQTPISDFARLNALVLIGVNPDTHEKEAERAFEVASLTLQQSRHLSVRIKQ